LALGRICRLAGGVICTGCRSSCQLDNARRSAKNVAHGLSRTAWDRLRQAALERDRHLCRFGFAGCTKVATTVHVDERLDGDHSSATLDDCLSACAHCHGIADGPRSRRTR
jgi:hypothetical protein